MIKSLSFLMLVAVLLVTGCDRSGESEEESVFGLSAGIVTKEESSVLDGPFVVSAIVSVTNVDIESSHGKTEHILFRGIKAIPNYANDKELLAGLKACFRNRDLYIHTNTVVRLPSGGRKAVVCIPTTQVCVGVDSKTNRLIYEVQNWSILQVTLLMAGHVMADANDVDYAYHDTFIKAESLARKYKRGYWATHTDPPSGIAISASSNVTTNKRP